jgi:ribosome biogenesis protein Nip4
MDKINEFIRRFTDKDIGTIKKIGRRYFLVDKKLEDFSLKINKDIFSIGIFLGELKGEFKATPALLEIIAKTSDVKVFVNRKSEWLFLCGRDIFEESIVKKNVDSGMVLVQNEIDENIGLGVFLSKKNSNLLKNIIDKGSYLRRER